MVYRYSINMEYISCFVGSAKSNMLGNKLH